MRTLHFGLRVADRERSLAFYRAVGYEVVLEVPETGLGHLTMLKLPGDEFVTVELVSGGDAGRGGGLSHFVVKVESMDATVAEVAARGLDVEVPEAPNGPDGLRTAYLTDPDGNRIELVQWPPGHPDGMTAAG